MNINIIKTELIKLINKAIKNNEVPIAALIIKNEKIISKKYNTVEKDKSVLSHSEIKVIKDASKKLNNWRLNDCELYVSLEPCDMCKQVIKKSRIKKVYYFTSQNEYKTEQNPSYEYINDNCFSTILSDFFKNNR